jgi:hypothetical protein
MNSYFLNYNQFYQLKDLKNIRCEVCGIRYSFLSKRLSCKKCNYFVCFSVYSQDNYRIKDLSLLEIVIHNYHWYYKFKMFHMMNGAEYKANNIQQILKITNNFMLLK